VHLIQRRHDNVVPPNLPALEAFLERRAKRAEALERRRRLAMSFLPLGNNIHRSNNLYLPDQGDPFNASVIFLAHYDTTFNAIGRGGSVLVPSSTLDATISTIIAPVFGAASLRCAASLNARCLYSALAGTFLIGQALTIEWWSNVISFGGNRLPYSTSLVNGSYFENSSFVIGTGRWVAGGRSGSNDTGVNLLANTWTAFAISKPAGNGGTGRYFVNGTQVDTDVTAGAHNGLCTSLVVGNDINLTQAVVGFTDEMRWTLAQRYTGASYPITGPFPFP